MATITIGRVLDASTDSVSTKELNQLVPAEYDYIELDPSDAKPTTVTFKTGGSGGTIVATLALVYNAQGEMISVTRT